MIEAADARKLAEELEQLRCAHYIHWSAQENHIAAVAVRHLRLLADAGNTGTDGGALPPKGQQ